MANRTFPELTDLFTSTYRIKRTIVANVVRSLREGGELDRGKTGLGAPIVNSQAATKVLLTLLVTDRPRDAVSTAKAYSVLVDQNGVTLLDRLAALIDAQRRGDDSGKFHALVIQLPSNDAADIYHGAVLRRGESDVDDGDDEYFDDIPECATILECDPATAIVQRSVECTGNIIRVIADFLGADGDD